MMKRTIYDGNNNKNLYHNTFIVFLYLDTMFHVYLCLYEWYFSPIIYYLLMIRLIIKVKVSSWSIDREVTTCQVSHIYDPSFLYKNE